MIVLGFDTATPSTAVGLRLADGSTLQARDDPVAGAHPGHATRLLGLAGELLAGAGLAWSAIDRVAVGLGPGRFTGLRVGVATARGLAQSLSLELVGVSSLRTLAQAAMRRCAQAPLAENHAPGVVLAVIDALRGEAFAGAYFSGEERSSAELSFAGALKADDLADVVVRAEERGVGRGRPWLAVGDGAVRYREQLQGAGVSVPVDSCALHLVDAGTLCALAAGAPAVASLAEILPDYRRPPDAERARQGLAAIQGSKL